MRLLEKKVPVLYSGWKYKSGHRIYIGRSCIKTGPNRGKTPSRPISNARIPQIARNHKSRNNNNNNNNNKPLSRTHNNQPLSCWMQPWAILCPPTPYYLQSTQALTQGHPLFWNASTLKMACSGRCIQDTSSEEDEVTQKLVEEEMMMRRCSRKAYWRRNDDAAVFENREQQQQELQVFDSLDLYRFWIYIYIS